MMFNLRTAKSTVRRASDMRRFHSMFVRERGRLLRKRCNATRVQLTRRPAEYWSEAFAAWRPFLLRPDTEVSRYREEMASRLSREAGLEPEAGADWKELLDQRARERALRADAGLSTLEEIIGAPDGWRERVDAERRAELARFARPEPLWYVRVPALKEGEVICSVPAAHSKASSKFSKICMWFMQKIFAARRPV